MTFPNDTINFLQELGQNNNRPWFQDNKTRYNAIQTVLIDFCDAIIHTLSLDDPSIANIDPRKCVYRIYRDVRFSHDKRPYKEHISFWIPCGGNKHRDAPGYYWQIAPSGNEWLSGNSLGGGVFTMDKNTPNLLRQEVFYRTEEFLDILHDKQFQKYYGTTLWDPYPTKTITANFRKLVGGIPDDYPHTDLLKHRNYVSMHYFDNAMALSDALLAHCLDAFRATIPLNNFFRDTLLDSNM